MEICSEHSPVFNVRLKTGPPKYETYETEIDVPPTW